jgi:RasGEF domain
MQYIIIIIINFNDVLIGLQFQDYKQYAVTGSLSDNPRLERSVNLFNGLTQWVQCMVLSRSTPQQRAEVIVKLIDVTKVKSDQATIRVRLVLVPQWGVG